MLIGSPCHAALHTPLEMAQIVTEIASWHVSHPQTRSSGPVGSPSRRYVIDISVKIIAERKGHIWPGVNLKAVGREYGCQRTTLHRCEVMAGLHHAGPAAADSSAVLNDGPTIVLHRSLGFLPLVSRRTPRGRTPLLLHIHPLCNSGTYLQISSDCMN